MGKLSLMIVELYKARPNKIPINSKLIFISKLS